MKITKKCASVITLKIVGKDDKDLYTKVYRAALAAKGLTVREFRAIARTLEEKEEVLGVLLNYEGLEAEVSFVVEARNSRSLQGRLIRVARAASGMTQVELAQKIGIDSDTLSRWEISGCGNAVYELEESLGVAPQTFWVQN